MITADEAYRGLRPEVLMLIAGMVVLGIALDQTGLARSATEMLISVTMGMSPLVALIIIYGVTLFATELLSNATTPDSIARSRQSSRLSEHLDCYPGTAITTGRTTVAPLPTAAAARDACDYSTGGAARLLSRDQT